MYLSLGYGSSLSISRLSSQMDTGNYIVGIIMGHTNNLLSYDKNSLDLFDHSYEKRYAELNQKSPLPTMISKKSN
jgi:hypothetical protein